MKPSLKTMEVNLISVIYSMVLFKSYTTLLVKLSKYLATQLASFYLSKNKDKGSLKALVLIASMGMLN